MNWWAKWIGWRNRSERQAAKEAAFVIDFERLIARMNGDSPMQEQLLSLDKAMDASPSAALVWQPPSWLWIENPIGCARFVWTRKQVQAGRVALGELEPAYAGAEFRRKLPPAVRRRLRTAQTAGEMTYREVFRLVHGPDVREAPNGELEPHPPSDAQVQSGLIAITVCSTLFVGFALEAVASAGCLDLCNAVGAIAICMGCALCWEVVFHWTVRRDNQADRTQAVLAADG